VAGDFCIIEAFHHGRWHRAAQVERVAGGARLDPTTIEYDVDYAATYLGARGVEAVSLRYPVNFDLRRVGSLPAFCIDLMPQGDARRQLLGRLARQGRDPTDWAILTHGAGNPVGNLRVLEAVAEPTPPHPGVARAELIARGDGYRAWAEAQGIPMTGSSDTAGASPKLLMAEDGDGAFHADGALDDDRAQRHFVVKFPRGRTRSDALVLATEAPYLEVLRALGLRCGEPLTYYDPGVLFVPRFDRIRRDEGIERRGMESAYALLGVVEAGSMLAFEALCSAVAAVVDDPERDIVELVLRDACCLALGNPDNHGRNTSLLKHADGSIALSPVYDFAPMYLDPEGIRRQTRWRSERKGGLDWSDVCASLDELVDRARLAGALRALGERLGDASRTMRDCGVEPSVIEDRARPIARVASALTKVEG